MHFCLIVGTRPQIIKSQPLVEEILASDSKLTLIHTGQHYDYQMSKVFFDELKIKNPDLNLGVQPNSSVNQLAQIILKLEKPLQKIKPDFVIIPGDTRSALGAAICANRLGIKIAHIEAGARSKEFDMEEEINRRLIDHCSNILFAPTKNCYDNLQNEAVIGKPHLSGDTMYDVFLKFKKILNLRRHDGKYILMTIHRKDNIENKTNIKKILKLVEGVHKKGWNVIFPIHPHTKKQIKSFGLGLDNLDVIEPVKYSKMLSLLSNASMLITDSGGLQKEAYWTGTPCITIRKSTEWIETLAAGRNVLLKTVSNSSIKTIFEILETDTPSKINPKLFGNGHAA
ncbi:MAG: non-hydrolyzing UDP-N-acetylglucosamine 2-epimerase, partial [Candidatus Nitrosotenuis sp.]